MSLASAQSLFESGNAYHAAGAWLDAAASFRACASLAPDNAGAQRNLGNALVKAGRSEEAIAAYRQCLALAPHDIDVMFELANQFARCGRLSEAVGMYVTCLRHGPDFGAAYVNLAGALRGLGVIDHALTMAEAGVRLMPDNIDALACLGGLLFDEAEFDAAAQLYGQALAHAPCHAGLLSSLANALHGAGHLDAALVLHDRAYASAPDEADYRYNRALSMLAAGDYRRGWAEHEWRLRRARTLRTMPDRGPAWDGGSIEGRTILLHAEQGLGDTLQFLRYVPFVAAHGARVVLELPAALVRIAGCIPSVAAIVTSADAVPAFDTHCAFMSLPHLLATTLPAIPDTTPYLRAEDDAVAGWRTRLPRDGRKQVGLVWAGGAHHGDIDSHLIDRRRSLPAAALANALAAWGAGNRVQFVSLQKDRAGLPEGSVLIDPMKAVADFADTAAIIANLDLVIAVDTAVAHLAGAMGKPVWLLSRYDGCWRWLDRQADTPWYPTMRIFRQPRPGDWGGVIEAVAEVLGEWAVRV